MSVPATSHLEETVLPRVVCSPLAAPPAIDEERDGSSHLALTQTSQEWTRFCGHCGQPVPWERLVNAITRKAKVFFCSDLHRFADANAKTKATKKLRQAKGICPSCHGRGYTRAKLPQRPSNSAVETRSEV